MLVRLVTVRLRSVCGIITAWGDSGGGNASMIVDATGGEGASGGDGVQTLRQLMATIMRDAWPGDGAAAGSGNVIRDDVWEEQLVGRLARGRTSKLAEQ